MYAIDDTYLMKKGNSVTNKTMILCCKILLIAYDYDKKTIILEKYICNLFEFSGHNVFLCLFPY